MKPLLNAAFQAIKHSELACQTITPSPFTRNANRTGPSPNRTTSNPGSRHAPSVSVSHTDLTDQSVREMARRVPRGLNKEELTRTPIWIPRPTRPLFRATGATDGTNRPSPPQPARKCVSGPNEKEVRMSTSPAEGPPLKPTPQSIT